MIRLPPTSIFLSSKDITQHLQEIDLYHGLLKQGFRRKDVRDFLKKQRDNSLKSADAQSLETPFRALGWADLASRGMAGIGARETNRTDRPISEGCDESKARATLLKNPMGMKNVSNVEHCTEESLGPPKSPDLALSSLHPVPASSPSPSPSPSPVRIKASNISTGRTVSNESTVHHHAPRQSSLLRFSRNISSDEQNHSQVEISAPPRSALSHEAEIKTCEDEQLETNSSVSSSSLTSVFEQLLLDDSIVPNKTLSTKRSKLRGDAKEFTPSGSLIQYSDAAQGHTAVAERPLLPRGEDFSWYTSPPANPRIVPMLQIKQPDDPGSVFTEQSSSPPLVLPNASPAEAPPPPQSSPVLPFMPSTPVFTRRSHVVRTDLRHRRHQHLDGNSFVPYNDSLPAEVQPQTPADLSRRSQVRELAAVYTAPPGRLRQGYTASSSDMTHGVGPGEQSPTTRAISMRQRRNREFARSARVEGLRINRTRRRFQMSRNDETDTLLALGDPWLDGGHDQLWRDDLDADRVGDENFEDAEQPLDPTEAVVRVVSGNRRAHGI